MTSSEVAPAPFASDAALAELAEGFVATTLPKARWTHAAHWAAALWLLSEVSPYDAHRDMPAMIRRYNTRVGTPNTDTEGYHETITRASLRAAAALLASQPAGTPLHEVANALLRSPLGRTTWLLEYWTRETLFSPQARRTFVEPDLAPLPF